MMNSIIQFSIRNKLITAFFTLVLVIWGIVSAMNLPIDAVPDITNNQVQIITVSPAYAAQDIERLITAPVEMALSTVQKVHEIRSISRFGLSVITVVLQEEADIYTARQQIAEKLRLVADQIPPGIGMPEIAPLTTGLGEIYQYTLSIAPGFENRYDPTVLRTIQDWTIRRNLLGTPGVADISSFGGNVKTCEIAINPRRLQAMNISITQIFKALNENNQNTGGAYIDKQPNAYFIRTEGLAATQQELENIFITLPDVKAGTPALYLRDIATIRQGSAIRYGAMVDGDKGEVVGGIVMMIKGENSSAVIQNVKKRIEKIQQSLPEGIEIRPFLDRTRLVNKAIGTVSKNLAEGALIVIFVLVLMLGNLRAGLLVASVIPLSMLFAIGMMRLFNVSGNLMSLGAIDFGLIVDGAVIIIESTLHHLQLRLSRGSLSQREMDEEVFQSASRIRSAAAFGEIIIMIVYLPIFALSGIEGKMFKPMAQTVAFAIAGAFILSLTYVPMMSALFLSRKQQQHKQTLADKLITMLRQAYRPSVLIALVHRRKIVILSFLMLAGGIILFTRLGGEFIPQLDEGDFAVETRLPTGSSLSEMITTAEHSARILQDSFPEVVRIISKIGTSEIPTDPMPLEACDLMIILKEKNEWVSADNREDLAAKMSEVLQRNMIGVSYGFQQPIQMRFNELISGARQDVVLKIFGENLDSLQAIAEKISSIITNVDGVTDLYIEQTGGLEQINIKFRRQDCARLGISIAQANQCIRAAFAGEKAGVLYEGEKRFDIMLRFDSISRNDLAAIGAVPLVNAQGQMVNLSAIADINLITGANQIQRENAHRRSIVGLNIRGRDVESVVHQIQALLQKKLVLPDGYYIQYGGSFENLQLAIQRLQIAVPAALLLIFFLLYFTVHSVSQALLIFTAIPLAALGGIVALWSRNMPFSISAGVGFIALFGVAVLNGIVLVAEFNMLQQSGESSLRSIILEGTQNRLRPVLMTALVASLGFLPMALSHGAGAEVQRPLATVVIGGLITSTALTLIVLPCLYYMLEQARSRKKAYTALPISILLFFVFPHINGQAQNQPILWPSVVLEYADQSPGIMSAKLQWQASKHLPGVAWDMGKTNVQLMQGQISSLYQDNNISITQTIPFPLVQLSQYNAALQDTLIAAQNQKIRQLQIYSMAFQAYLRLMSSRAKQHIIDSLGRITALAAKAAELREKQGETSGLEYNGTALQLIENTMLRQKNQAEEASAYQVLLAILNQKSLLLPPAETALDSLEFILRSWESKHSVQQIPMIISDSALWQKKKFEASAEKARFYPDIMLGYFNQSLRGIQNINGVERVFGSADRFTGFQIGISLPLIFNAQLARVENAQLQEQAQFLEYKNNARHSQGTLQALIVRKDNLLSLQAEYNLQALQNANLLLERAAAMFNNGQMGYAEYYQYFSRAALTRLNAIDQRAQYLETLLQISFFTGI
jgi:cobalt-zinc-cadmium resistance protein CzcA